MAYIDCRDLQLDLQNWQNGLQHHPRPEYLYFVMTSRLRDSAVCFHRWGMDWLAVHEIQSGISYPCLLLAFSRLARDSTSVETWPELPTLICTKVIHMIAATVCWRGGGMGGGAGS